MNRLPYPAYKPSGVKWLGEIPAHWEVSRLGYAFRLQAGFAFQSESFSYEGVPIVKMSNLKEGQLDLSDATKIPDDQCMPEFALEVGDLVIGMSGSINNFAVVGGRDLPCQLNQRVGRFLRTGLKATFYPYLQHLVSSGVFMEQMELIASGAAQANISSHEVGHFSIALPPADEQRAIATYLDHETTRIDTLIEKKQKQIELLQEKRTALISRAVTKGLDPNAKMKDSGIAWLGEIPARWKVLSCKFAYAIQLGKMLQNEPQSATDVKVPYLKALHVQWETVDTSDPPEMWASQHDVEKFSVESDDLLVCEGGEVGRAGVLADAPDNCIIQNALHRVRAKARNEVRFLMYLLEVAASGGWFDILCNKATIAHFTGEKFGDFLIALPLPSEQRAITAYLNRETTHIDTLTKKITKSITLLREYRTSLISAAVTGKIDVRKETTV